MRNLKMYSIRAPPVPVHFIYIARVKANLTFFFTTT